MGQLPIFRNDDDLGRDGRSATSEEESEDLTRLHLTVNYKLRIRDRDALIAFASGRFGAAVTDITAAVGVLFEAESWDPARYPPGVLS